MKKQMRKGLPDLISIDRLKALPLAQISVPGSKSITNRALIAAALRTGKTTLEGALWSEDSQVMLMCLKRLGFDFKVRKDADEDANRSIEFWGKGGFVPDGGSRDSPMELFVSNAGTAARFLMAMLCLGRGFYRLSGNSQMHKRPQIGLISSLKKLGYELESSGGHLPIIVCGSGPKRASCSVDISESSQFESALLLSAEAGKWSIESSNKDPYVKMTRELIREFRGKRRWKIEADASSGSYFLGVNALGIEPISRFEKEAVSVKNWPKTDWQMDASFPTYLKYKGAISRKSDLGDSIMTAIVLAAKADGNRQFLDLGRLRLQECERVFALKTELARCGIQVSERGDSLNVEPGKVSPATIQTYEDHRIAMCFSMLALSSGSLKISNPQCVKKTFPTFFEKLATPPPKGLGAIIRDGKTGEVLRAKNLIAI